MSLVKAVLDVVRPLARKAVSGEDDEHLDLAAHAFAVSQALREHGGDASFASDPGRHEPGQTLQDACRKLTALVASTSPADLYWELTDFLRVVDSTCRDRSHLRRTVKLAEIFFGDKRAVHGDVSQWRRPVSVLRELRAARADAQDQEPVASRAPVPAHTPADDLRHLGMYWHSDPTLPQLTVVTSQHPSLRDSGHSAAVRKRFRIGLCPLRGRFHTRFDIDAAGRYFTAHDIAGRAELQVHLAAVLNAAAAEQLDLLVLPELCVDDDARRFLISAPRSHGIVAGSFHFERPVDGTPAAVPSLHVNEAVLYDPFGAVVLTHHKRGVFSLSREQVNAEVMQPFFVVRPDELEATIREGIRWGTEIQVLDTSLGRLAVFICADAVSSRDARGYRTLVERVRPDLLFVVSMSPETEPFERFCKEMAEQWIGTVFVNAACVCIGRAADKDVILAAGDVALIELPGSAPTRFRWRHGCADVERFDFHARKKEAQWCTHAPDAAASWLGGEQRLGLVLDLGVHWIGEQQQTGNLS